MPSRNAKISESSSGDKAGRRHLIRKAWIRRPLKVLGALILFILLLPVLAYLPPVQTLLKDAACKIVGKSTGMQVKIDRFRLRFPLDIELDGVRIIEASGDTMLSARALIADVKMRPLLRLDAQLNRLELHDATYAMTSADSSLTLSLRAGYLRTEAGSYFNLRDMHLRLRQPVLKDAIVNVDMNVWKQQKDTASSPTRFLIEADKLTLSRVTYSMTMPPVIASLSATIDDGIVKDASVNLTDSHLSFGSVDVRDGNVSYLTPTAEYIKAHPAPADTTSASSASPPMTIEIGDASLHFSRVLYATQNARPLPGFDPSYIEVAPMSISLHDFYNRQSSLRLPVSSLKASERSGLHITRASGLVAIDSTGLSLSDFSLSTPASSLSATASLPFALMSMQQGAPSGEINASGSIAWSDIYAFMPALRNMLRPLPAAFTAFPIDFDIKGRGSMQKVIIDRLGISSGRFISLAAEGHAVNPTDLRKLNASLTFSGSMQDPAPAMQLLRQLSAATTGVRVPKFAISGTAQAIGRSYSADIALRSPAGNVAAKGSVALGPESYDLDARLASLSLGEVMPSLGLGTISGTIHASGTGFNPAHPGASATMKASMQELSYNGCALAPLSLDAEINHGEYGIDMRAAAPHFNLSLDGKGHIDADTYYIDADADVTYLDLQALGLMSDICRGSGKISLHGNANPTAMLFDLDMSTYDVDWEYAGKFYALRQALDASLLATEEMIDLEVHGRELNAMFHAPTSLKSFMAAIDKAMPLISSQIAKKQIDFEALQPALPPFSLSLDAQGSGLLSELLDGTGYSAASLRANISNDSKILGDIKLLSASSGEQMTLDTVTLNLSQRGKLMDYRLHLGNRPGNMPEFAQVTASGYVGGNRASLFVRQQNAKGETGYRLGVTAAMLDSVLALHLTPVKAVIGYKNWTINDDNYINIGPGRRIAADLQAASGASSIALHSSVSGDSLPALDVDINNLLIEDFLQIAALAPPVTGAIDSRMHLVYRGSSITGNGSVGVSRLRYDGMDVGDLDFNFKAGMNFNGNVGCSLGLLLNKSEILRASGYILNDSTAAAHNTPQLAQLKVDLLDFPLDIANPFIGPDIMKLDGHLNGSMKLTGSMEAPLLNGEITCDSVGVYIPMAASRLHLDSSQPITVKDNSLLFENFNIYASGKNPITLTGYLDAKDLSDIRFDMSLAGNNVALVNNKRSAGSDIYGQLFVTLAAHAKGSLSRMTVDGNMQVLPATNIFYTLASASGTPLSGQPSTTDVVKFVQFSDSTMVVKADTLRSSTTAMRITASLGIISGAKVTVNLSGNGTDKVQISPSGNLSYLQTYMGDMRLNGTLSLGSGFARYSLPAIGDKSFDIDPESYVTWTGDILNPSLHINATDHVKANVQQEGANSRLIYFDVLLSVLGTLNAPKVSFDLSTDDDITVQNELQGMTAEQRSASAINLLLYNTYTGPGVKASANLGGNPLYSFLEGQLNSLAAKYITGVDLSFGIDQYDKTVNGETSGTTSYSYQVSKSLFDNRFKIVVGGNYSTDANADENFAQNLISDISFEYSLRQTATSSMYVRLFRHTGFESILEGEITETGVGFVLKRKIADLRSLFRLGRNKKATADSLPADTPPAAAEHWQKIELPSDTSSSDL